MFCYLKCPVMKLYLLFLKDGMRYWMGRVRVLAHALSLVYSAPVDAGLTRSETRRSVSRASVEKLKRRDNFFHPAFGRIALR